MQERFPGQRKAMGVASRNMETAWQIVTYPRKYDPKLVIDAMKFLRFQTANFSATMKLEPDGSDPYVSHKDLDDIYMGMFHKRAKSLGTR